MKTQAITALETVRLTKQAKEAKLQANRDKAVIGDETEIEQLDAQRSLFIDSSTSNNKG